MVSSPNFHFLVGQGGAQWIRFDEPFLLNARAEQPTTTCFRTRIFVPEELPEAVLTVRAMRHVNVLVDGNSIYRSSNRPDNWKGPHRVNLASALTPGQHEILLAVLNHRGPPCVLAYCKMLDLFTGEHWEASRDEETWTLARSVDHYRAPELSRAFPRADKAFLAKWFVFIPVFGVALCLGVLHRRGCVPQRLIPSPGGMRWLLLLAWCVLGIHNLPMLPPVGFDHRGHWEYIEYVSTRWRVPLAHEGWQMFQSPLYYFVSAVLLRLLPAEWGREALICPMRIIPFLSGMAQIEITFRLARVIYPQRKDLQKLALILGGLLPMNMYLSQMITNEPTAGLFAGLTVLFAARYLHSVPRDRPRMLLAVGGLLGLALLSKVSAVLLVIPILFLILVSSYRELSRTPRRACLLASKRAAIAFGLAALIAGWYYLRNWVVLGAPFVGGWQQGRGISWWQDPGYRTFAQLFSFGESLFYPVLSSSASFWDGVYSTFWMDALVGGTVQRAAVPPWNYDYQLAGMWLSLAPTAGILLGIYGVCRTPRASAESGLLFVGACVGVYFAALVVHFLTNPAYCAVKSFYTVGMTSGYAVLGSRGLGILTRTNVSQYVMYGVLGCWALAAYLGCFVV